MHRTASSSIRFVLFATGVTAIGGFLFGYDTAVIVPAAVGPYTVQPHGPSIGRQWATLKAFIRT